MAADSVELDPPGPRIDRPPHATDLMTVVPAVPAALAGIRTLVREWLDTIAWPVGVAEDIELAVNEAIANVIDHAYPPEAPGPATLHAWVSTDPRTGSRRVVVTVTDRGRWAAYQPDHPPPSARGHGLIIMRGCMAQLHIQRAAAGTTVIMISPAVPR